MPDKRHSAKLNLNAGETAPCRVSGHFGHSGHQIGKLFYKPSIEDFPKPLSYPSNVSTQAGGSKRDGDSYVSQPLPTGDQTEAEGGFIAENAANNRFIANILLDD
jgi:hypothetical protein